MWETVMLQLKAVKDGSKDSLEMYMDYFYGKLYDSVFFFYILFPLGTLQEKISYGKAKDNRTSHTAFHRFQYLYYRFHAALPQKKN